MNLNEHEANIIGKLKESLHIAEHADNVVEYFVAHIQYAMKQAREILELSVKARTYETKDSVCSSPSASALKGQGNANFNIEICDK
jgi:hypothetical protein